MLLNSPTYKFLFVDGFTRVGKDTFIDQLVRKIVGTDYVLISSNKDIYSPVEGGGTDAIFMNIMNIINRIDHYLEHKDSESLVIVNRSLMNDLSYLVLSMVIDNYYKNSNCIVDDFSSLKFNNYVNRLVLVINTTKYLKSILNDTMIYLIENPMYHHDNYLDNLNSPKADFHCKHFYNKAVPVKLLGSTLRVDDSISTKTYYYNNLRLLYNSIYLDLASKLDLKVNIIRNS